jgi:hypothetical protein
MDTRTFGGAELMSMKYLVRRLRVTALLSASGAVVGAATAVALSFLATSVAQATMSGGRVEYYFEPLGFAIVGATGTPLLTWLLMRRVPLWRAIAEPAIGGVLGTLVALSAIPLVGAPILFQPLCVLTGIVGAGIRLRYAHRGLRDAGKADAGITTAAF